MAKLDPRLMHQLREALRRKDMQEMQVACARFPTVEEGAQAAQYLLENDMPPDVRAWWLEEECDLPHDPKSVLDEAVQLIALVQSDIHRTDQNGG